MPTLLLIDDDPVFLTMLARSLKRRGWDSLSAHDEAEALSLLAAPPAAAVDVAAPPLLLPAPPVEVDVPVLAPLLAVAAPPVTAPATTAYLSGSPKSCTSVAR